MPGPLGGDRRAVLIGAHASLILEPVARAPDMTLHELEAMLAEAGIQVGAGTLWRFFDRHQLTLKKRRTPPNRTIPTS